MKRFAIVSALAAAVFAFAGVSQAASLKISHVRPEGATIDKELRTFASEVDAATGGDVTVRLYPASALGDYTTVQERISIGAVDMAVQPAATGVERRMQISSLPYLAGNWEHAREIYGPGGAVREAMGELYARQDIRMLAAYPVYFGGISLNREPVSPGEVGVDKGVKVRVPGIKSFQLLAESLGYIPSPIPFSDAFTAVQTGVVDGVIGSGAEGYYASFRDVTETYIPMNTHFEVWYMIISEMSFRDLSAAHQQKLTETAQQFEARRWEAAKADQAANEQKLADYGATIVEISDAQLAAAAEKVRAEVWPVIFQDIGEDWVRGVLSGTGALSGMSQ